MSSDRSILSETPAAAPLPGTVEVMIVRLEGKIDRLVDSLSRHGEDMKMVRERLHEQANHLSALTALNIPDKLAALRDGQEAHELRIRPIETEVAKVSDCQARLDKHDIVLTEIQGDMNRRRGAVALARALWAIVTLIGIGGIVAIVKALGGHFG